MTQDESMTRVYAASGMPQAYIIKGRLETEGIPVLLSYESAGIVYGLTVDGLGLVSVMVPTSLAEKAVEILNTGNVISEDSAPGEVSENQNGAPEAH